MDEIKQLSVQDQRLGAGAILVARAHGEVGGDEGVEAVIVQREVEIGAREGVEWRFVVLEVLERGLDRDGGCGGGHYG